MNTGRAVLVAGIALLAVGVATILAPAVVPLTLDRVIVVVFGILVLLLAVRVMQRRRNGRLDVARTPDPERSVSTPQPGDDMGSVIASLLDRRRVYTHVWRIRDGLTEAAVAVLSQFEGASESDARAQVADGTWTDDREAAWFLGDSEVSGQPLRTRLRHRLARGSSTQRRIRRTVAAIGAIVDRRAGTNLSGNGTPGRAGETRSTSDDDSNERASTTDATRFDDGADEIVSRQSHSTGQWRGVSVVALVGIGVGVIVQQPAVLLGGVVGIGYAAYARSPALPPGSVSVERTLSTQTPDMGETVTVTVTVRNTGDRVRPDIRVVDGVPEALAVETGSPRCGTTLRPGERTSFSYTVAARRGVHEFGPALVVGRNLTGETEEERLYASGTTLTCVPSLSPGTEPVPLRRTSTRFVGQEPTPTTGAGIEFSATREYRAGDPMGRIDWKRHARTRELTTIEFREERAATVVLLVDARPSAYVSPDSETGHAVDRAVEAAGQLFTQLEDAGNRVGIAVAGSDSCWLDPDTGVEHRSEARELLAVSPALSPVPNEQRSGSRRWQITLRKRLEAGTQLVVLSSLVDEGAGGIARQFDERGFPVTVISPDPTTQRSPSHRLASIVRQLHASELRGAGIPVVDWAWEEPLDAALARYDERGPK